MSCEAQREPALGEIVPELATVASATPMKICIFCPTCREAHFHRPFSLSLGENLQRLLHEVTWMCGKEAIPFCHTKLHLRRTSV